MKHCLGIFFWLCALSLSGQANWNNSSYLHRSGRAILDGTETPVRLEGVNLGGWLMWEGWIWGGGFTKESTIYTKISNKLGQAQADQFRDAIHSGYITRQDIQRISEQCYTIVRIPFNHAILEDDSAPYVYKQSGWNLLDSVLAWCEEYNVYALLDLHGAPGGQSSYFIADPDTPNMWNDAEKQARTAELWKAIANRYKDRGIVAGYDLLNEPNAPSDAALVAFYDILVDSIRSVDTNHLLFIEGKTASTDFTIFDALPDENMVFAFHFYTWFVFNIPNALNEFVQLSEQFNVPVWCGEWGENNYQQLTNTLSALQLPASQISGEAFWTWKKHIDGSDYPYYVGIDSSALWNKSITWIGNPFAPQPTVAEMQQGITDFLENMRLENGFFNDTMNAVLQSCEPAAVNEAATARPLEVFPVPANGFVQLTLPHPNDSRRLRLFNAQGAAVLRVEDFGESDAYTLDMRSVENGVYLLLLETASGLFKARVVVAH